MTRAQRYNNRMDKIWETVKRLERERLARGERPNPNLTDVTHDPFQPIPEQPEAPRPLVAMTKVNQ